MIIFFADDLIQLLGPGSFTVSISLSSANPNPSKVKTKALVLPGYSDSYIKPKEALGIYRGLMDSILVCSSYSRILEQYYPNRLQSNYLLNTQQFTRFYG